MREDCLRVPAGSRDQKRALSPDCVFSYQIRHRAFGDGPRNFEPRSIKEDKLPYHANERTLNRDRFNVHHSLYAVGIKDGDRFNSCQVIYSQFGLTIHQNDDQARRRFVEWAKNEIAVVPDFHKRILFSNEAHFWLNGYVNKQNCRIWSEANPQVYVETPLHPEKLTVWCALWAGGILLQKR
ncbi:hypothetical protein TNCV_2049041 [Trichonephila clavipes]|nr:hypothetical protein TNCV_2049041 [Trichonephila clavipes]